MSGTVQMPDVSSYAHPGGGNAFSGIMAPLEMMGKVATIQNAMNQNEQFQQMFRARTALGPIYQNAIGADGNFDINKFITGVASHPETSWMAGEVINQALQRQLTQADILNKQLDASAKTFEHVAMTAGGLLAKVGPGGKVGFSDVLEALSNAVALGYVPKDQALTWLKELPRDPDGLTKVITQVAYANKTAADTLAKVRGDISQVDMGGGITFVRTSPVEGTVTQVPVGGTGPAGPQGAGAPGPGGGLVKTPTPGEANALVPSKGNRGEPLMTPRAQAAPMVDAAGRPIPGTGQGAVPPTQVGPPQEALDFMEGKGEVAEYSKDLSKAYASAQQSNIVLDHMMSLLFDENGQPRAPVGPGSSAYTAAANFAESIGMNKERADAFAGGDRGARQEFMKLAVGQAFQQIRQWLGGEGRLAVAEFTRTLDEGSPNPNMQPSAIKSIIGFMQMLNQVKELEREEFGKFIDAQQGNGWKQLPRHWQPIWGDILKKSGIEPRLVAAAKAASKAYKTGTP